MFKSGDIVILNNYAQKGLPMRIGQRVTIIDQIDSFNYDYQVEFDDNGKAFVRECELDELTDEIKIYMSYIFTNNKVLYFYDEVIVENCDYLHKKAEIKFEDESSLVVDFDKLHLITTKENNSVVENISRSDKHRQVIEEIHTTFKIKNADYGNSFGEQFEEYGLLSAVIRLDDKMRRLKQLMKQDAQVKDESIRDTVLDMANYAIMTVMELDGLND